MISWNNNNIDGVVEYINNELAKGRQQRLIEEQDFGVNEKVIVNRLKRRGYNKVDGRWVLGNPVKKEVSNTNVLHTSPVVKQPVIVEPAKMGYVLDDKEALNKILSLANNHDRIIKLLDMYDKQYDGLSPLDFNDKDIVITLPTETKKDFRTSIRVNHIAWENFSEFCDKNIKAGSKKELLSMALIEYIKNHSRE